MGNHSYWCDVSKSKACDCGFEELKLARSILLEVYNNGATEYNSYDDLVCRYCNVGPDYPHNNLCTYLKLHNFLEQYNAPKE